MILRYIFYGFLVYLAYRLIFHFIIPVAKTTRQVRRQFDEVRNRMQEQQMQDHFNPGTASRQQSAASQAEKGKGDYIDFEEIKD
ncbi:MAG: hypothetical protein MUE58_04555 [Chitinophagaceae bacterium]|nr:hypothetical protein [Chitinophagaceae bacterium]